MLIVLTLIMSTCLDWQQLLIFYNVIKKREEIVCALHQGLRKRAQQIRVKNNVGCHRTQNVVIVKQHKQLSKTRKLKKQRQPSPFLTCTSTDSTGNVTLCLKLQSWLIDPTLDIVSLICNIWEQNQAHNTLQVVNSSVSMLTSIYR